MQSIKNKGFLRFTKGAISEFLLQPIRNSDH